jgi:hypothetical protein
MFVNMSVLMVLAAAAVGDRDKVRLHTMQFESTESSGMAQLSVAADAQQRRMSDVVLLHTTASNADRRKNMMWLVHVHSPSASANGRTVHMYSSCIHRAYTGHNRLLPRCIALTAKCRSKQKAAVHNHEFLLMRPERCCLHSILVVARCYVR